MDIDLFAEKIKLLSDDKLKELLQLKNKHNAHIMELAEREALRRNIDLGLIERKMKDQSGTKTEEDQGFNWMELIAQFLSAVKD